MEKYCLDRIKQNERDSVDLTTMLEGRNASLVQDIRNLHLTANYCNWAWRGTYTSWSFASSADAGCHPVRCPPSGRRSYELSPHELAFHTASPGHRPHCRVVIYVCVYVVFYFNLAHCPHNSYVFSKLTLFFCVDCACARRAASHGERFARLVAAIVAVVVAIGNHGLASIL